MGNAEVKDVLRHAEEGNLSSVKKLVRDSAAVHVADETGNTALHCAVFQGHFEVARILLRAGASVNVPNSEGDTPIHLAALGKRLKCLKLLTPGGKANVGAQNLEGFTPLHFSAGEGHIAGMKHLLDCGPAANPRTTNQDGHTPLAMAVAQNQLAAVEFLLDTDPAVINWKDADGDTCLHIAVQNKNLDIVELLARTGSDLSLHGADDLTPYELAVHEGSKDIAEKLLSLVQGQAGDYLGEKPSVSRAMAIGVSGAELSQMQQRDPTEPITLPHNVPLSPDEQRIDIRPPGAMSPEPETVSTPAEVAEAPQLSFGKAETAPDELEAEFAAYQMETITHDNQLAAREMIGINKEVAKPLPLRDSSSTLSPLAPKQAEVHATPPTAQLSPTGPPAASQPAPGQFYRRYGTLTARGNAPAGGPRINMSGGPYGSVNSGDSAIVAPNGAPSSALDRFASSGYRKPATGALAGYGAFAKTGPPPPPAAPGTPPAQYTASAGSVGSSVYSTPSYTRGIGPGGMTKAGGSRPGSTSGSMAARYSVYRGAAGATTAQ
mmetsp:Transcript_22964/g.53618  ORF Transcript_22964/g.53618 Transcript_22964/m.53618 type:complete len:549 (-) Transcript_22964:449-2095(-)